MIPLLNSAQPQLAQPGLEFRWKDTKDLPLTLVLRLSPCRNSAKLLWLPPNILDYGWFP